MGVRKVLGWLSKQPATESQSGPRAAPAGRSANSVDESDIANAYRLVLRRDPDAAGLRHYSDRMAEGLSLPELFASLVASGEYAALSVHRSPDGEAPAAAASSSRPIETSADSIDPHDVIRSQTIEALNQTAEEYYRRIDDPTPLMSKPFTFLHETPEILQNLGCLLAGLHLGKTMRVLDFGAGTCWLSRMLAQLNCQPVCCDVSASALAIGRRLFVEQPPIGTAVYAPEFLPFDGHRLAIPDASIDRIVSFDAFHHVPNQAEVLAEFARVLRPGGVAGFSEPGRHHSQSPQSQYEMRAHRVLENDVDLDRIFEMARSIGFTDMRIRALNDTTVDLDGYRRLMREDGAGTPAAALVENTREIMSTRSIFFLHKGPLRPDSRSHLGLAHRLEVDRTTYVVADGASLDVDLRVTNAGTAHWLAVNSEIFGIVRMGAHLYDSRGALVTVDHSRHGLPSDVAPGETIAMSITIPLPEVGSFDVELDLVAEGVAWFENRGSTPVRLAVRRG